MLPISDYVWTERQSMHLVSTVAYVYFKDVSAPLESIWYIKENEIKQARQKRKKEKNN